MYTGLDATAFFLPIKLIFLTTGKKMRAAIYILQQFSGFLNGYCLNTKNDLNYHCKKKKKDACSRHFYAMFCGQLWVLLPGSLSEFCFTDGLAIFILLFLKLVSFAS